jgi:Putative DNA-binding domain
MLDMPIEALNQADLERLVINQVTEGRTLDFKRSLPGGSDAEIKEFLADVSSFANAQGGDLVFGIEESAGAASAVTGIEVSDGDAAILRLENSLRDNISPRLIGVRMVWVLLASGKCVLVMRISAGFAAPHRVVFKGQGRFYNRNSAGKFEMDVHDLRHAFTESGSLPSRFRQLHAEAIERAKGWEMPLRIKEAPTAVVSVMPISLFREERDLSVSRDHALVPIEPSGYSSIDMIEGILVHSPLMEGSRSVRSFAITHRTGRADIAWTIGGRREIQGQNRDLVFHPSFENGLLDAAVSAQTQLRIYGIEGPWVIFASVFNILSHYMVLGDGYPTSEAYKDQALLGEIRADQFDEDVLRPIANNLWLLFGVRRPEALPLRKR